MTPPLAREVALPVGLPLAIDAATIEAYRALPTATVYEAAGKLGDMSPVIRSVTPGACMVGPAFTLKTMPGDNSSVMEAIRQAPRGSVLVIDGGGSERVTIWGGTSTVAAVTKGLAGCVTNASVRDMSEILECGFPVFAAGISLRGTSKSHPGWMNIPVSVGDVIVRPGDLILADADGVLVVAAERVAGLLPLALKKRAAETAREHEVRAEIQALIAAQAT